MARLFACACILAALALAPLDARASEASEIEAAITWAKPVMGSACDFSALGEQEEFGGSHFYQIDFRYKGQGQDEPDQMFPLVQLYCLSGAYNVSFIYLTKGNEAGEYKLLSFAEPKLDFDYQDENFTLLKAPPTISGYISRTELVNASFDPVTSTIHSDAKWRGLGDAWSVGEWRFDEGQFVLSRFTVDPIYELNGPGEPIQAQKDLHFEVFPGQKQ
jgi:hypothetical protein